MCRPETTAERRNMEEKKNMCKKVVLCLLVVLCLTTVSIAETADLETLFGQEVNGTYENSFLGLGCSFPDWHYASEEEMKEQYQKAIDSVSSEIADIIQKSGNVTIMSAEAPSGSMNVNIQVQYAKDYIPLYNMLGLEYYVQEFCDPIKETLEGSGFENVQIEPVKTKIGEQEFNGLHWSYIMQGVQVYTRQIQFIRDPYMVYVTATSFLDDTTENVYQAFYELP